MTESLDERLGLPTASPWRRYELCAGSWQLEGEAERLGQTAHRDSPAAKSGKRMHAYLAGQPDEDGHEIVLTDTERTTADFLQERAQDQVARIFGEEPVQQLDEKRLWLVLNGQKVASGRFDRVVYTNTVAMVQDFKTGWSEPEPAEQNAQGKVLAVLVALHLPSVKEVIVQIISGPYGVTEARYGIAELAKAYSAILATLKAIHEPTAPLTPGVEQCRYCPAINVCPAVKALVPAMKEVEALPDGARGSELLDQVEVLQKRLDAIREYYHGRLSGDPAFDLPGWGLAPGPQRREVANWKAAKTRLEEFVGAEELEQLANYSIPNVEKLIAKALKLKAKEAGLKLAEILGDLLTVRQGNLCLKRVSGKPKLVTVELP